MADELRLRILAEHRFESLETRGPEPFTFEVRHLLKVDENGHAEFCGERVDPLQLWSVGLDVELQLAEANRTGFHRLGET